MPMSIKVISFVLGLVYIAISVLNLVFPEMDAFPLLQMLFCFIYVAYCVTVMLRNRSTVQDKSVRTVCTSLSIVSFCLVPYLAFASFFPLLRLFTVPLIALAYSIPLMVFFYVAISRQDADRGLKPSEQRALSFEDVSKYHITEREFEIVKLIKEGLTNKEIASELGISVNTVNNHIANIFSKTEVRSRIDLLNLLQESIW